MTDVLALARRRIAVPLVALAIGCYDAESPPTVDSIEIDDIPGMEVGDSLQLRAIVKDQRGFEMRRQVVWSSSHTDVATVTPAGLLKAVGEGLVLISATVGGRHDFIGLFVAPKPAAALRPPHSTDVARGE